jgi:integrase
MRAKPRKNVVIRYLDANGKRVPKGTPGAVKTREESRDFYVTLTHPDGTRKPHNLRTPNYDEAISNQRKLERQIADEAAGIVTPEQSHARVNILKHRDDWLSALEAEGARPEYLMQLRTRTGELIRLAGWKSLAAVTADSCLKALAKVQKLPHYSCLDKSGRSIKTRNYYLLHMKQFTRWLVDEERLYRDPIRRLKRIDPGRDIRRVRRIPTDDEVARLMAAAQSGRRRMKTTGPERALLYAVAMFTGLRASECRHLGWPNFDLEDGVVTLSGAFTKNKKEAVIDLPAELVDRLKDWKARGGRFWSHMNKDTPGKCLRYDLEQAGVAYKKDGKVLDFHSLRHWIVTQFAADPTVHPNTAKELARHSSIDLTMNVYAKVDRRAKRAAMAGIKLPTSVVAN